MRLFLILASLVAVDAVKTDSVTLSEHVQLVYHPSDFIESTGSLAIRRGDLGFRAIGYDGMTALILYATPQAVVLHAEPDYAAHPRDVVLDVPAGGRIGFSGVQTEDSICGERYMHALVNGEEVLIPYYSP